MRHFATESGKSKGQFYTPAEVSRIMAQIIGIRGAKTSASTTEVGPTTIVPESLAGSSCTYHFALRPEAGFPNLHLVLL
jgi:hypothetical protein